jgi:hypothetical protein
MTPLEWIYEIRGYIYIQSYFISISTCTADTIRCDPASVFPFPYGS